MKKLFKVHWLFFVILFLAFSLRMFRIETLTSFQGDQGRDLMAVRNIIVNYDLTLLGSPSTFGPFQGPLYYYLLVPGLFLFRLPLGGLLTSVLFNVAGLILLYHFCVRFFSKSTAFNASVLYALSPLMTELGRTLLNAYFGLPIFIAALYVLMLVFLEKKVRFAFLLGLLSGSLIQLHYNFAPFFLFLLILPLFFPHVSKARYYLLFFSSFFLASFPQILFEFRHEFLNTKLLLQSIQSGEAAGKFSYSYISFFLSTLGYLLGWKNLWYGLVVLIFVITGLYSVQKAPSGKKRTVLNLLNFYFLFFIIVALFARVKLVYPAYHYYMSIFPLFFIFASLVLQDKKKIVRIGVFAFFIFISLKNLNLFRNHGFTMVDNWSMRKQQEIARVIAFDVESRTNWNVASVVDGDTQGLPIRYHLAVEGADNFLGVEEYPKSDVLYLVTRDEKDKVFDYQVWEVASLQPFEITKEWKVDDGINVYRIERLN